MKETKVPEIMIVPETVFVHILIGFLGAPKEKKSQT